LRPGAASRTNHFTGDSPKRPLVKWRIIYTAHITVNYENDHGRAAEPETTPFTNVHGAALGRQSRLHIVLVFETYLRYSSVCPRITRLRPFQKAKYGPSSRKAQNRNHRNTLWYFEDCDSSLTMKSDHGGPLAEVSTWEKRPFMDRHYSNGHYRNVSDTNRPDRALLLSGP
jgi:hypothetical protein